MARICVEASFGISSPHVCLWLLPEWSAQGSGEFPVPCRADDSCDFSAVTCKPMNRVPTDAPMRSVPTSSGDLTTPPVISWVLTDGRSISAVRATLYLALLELHLFAVKSEDVLQALSQCRPVEYGETSGSTCVATDHLGNHVLTCEEEGLIESEREEFSTSWRVQVAVSTRVILDGAALFTVSGSWVVLLSDSQPAAQSPEAVVRCAIRTCESTLRSLPISDLFGPFRWRVLLFDFLL